MRREAFEIDLGNMTFQNIFATLRLLLFFITLFFFASNFSFLFHEIAPMQIAQEFRANNPVFEKSAQWLVVLVASLINPYVIRYTIAPLSAVVCAMILGAYFVRDIYELPSIGSAMHYVLASMFTFDYPILKVDHGGKQLKKGEVNLIDKIGGPGSVLIEPGSAAIFRELRGRPGTKIAGTYFLRPFEAIANTVDLDEQQGDKDEIKCMSRDGIKVLLRDIHYRYRIMSKEKRIPPAPRTIEDPYPFSEDALINMTANLSVNADGRQEPWSAAMTRAVVGQITDFVAEHTIDYLTAPREKDMWPREELIQWIYNTSIPIMNNQGAELLWVDVGHMEIEEGVVDDQRASLWAADWVGNATVARAYGEAKRQAYQELGRAEAQAEMIISIADALSSTDIGNDNADNIRRILLSRTAQLLDAMYSKRKTNPETRL